MGWDPDGVGPGRPTLECVQICKELPAVQLLGHPLALVDSLPPLPSLICTHAHILSILLIPHYPPPLAGVLPHASALPPCRHPIPDGGLEMKRVRLIPLPGLPACQPRLPRRLPALPARASPRSPWLPPIRPLAARPTVRLVSAPAPAVATLCPSLLQSDGVTLAPPRPARSVGRAGSTPRPAVF